MSKQSRPSVCIIVENLPVPFDRRVWREASALRDAGHRVSVIRPKGNGIYSAGYQELEGVEIYRHSVYYGSHALSYLLEYSWALVAELLLAFKVLARTRFRVLQGCNPPDTIFIIALILRPFGVRFVFDQHDLTPELFEAKFAKRNGPLHTLVRLAERSSFRAADICLVANESFQEIAIRRGKKRPDDVFVVRNSPDLASLCRGRVRPKIKRGKPWLVVYVGLMAAHDGVNLLVQSIEHIRQTH